MNLILIQESDFIEGSGNVRLSDRRFFHIRKVLRAKIGDELRVGLINDRIGVGRILEIADDFVEMEVLLKRDPPAALSVKLILALPRPIMLKRILQSVSSLGIKEIFLINSSRVEKSFWKSPVLQEQQLREQLILGLEQAGDTIFPRISLYSRFKPFVEDVLLSIIKDTIPLIAHPESDKTCPCFKDKWVTLMIGPEGGFIPYEVAALKSLGFSVVSLGERILRVETAVSVLLSKFIW